MTTVAADQLAGFIDRILRLREEKRAIRDDIKDVYRDAAELGFDRKAMKRLVKVMETDPADRKEADTIFNLYADALGIVR